MKFKNYLNIGCGGTFHEEWTNIDMNVNSPFVLAHNLLKGLPFEDDSFDVVYHSQVLEHFPKSEAPHFIAECYRVLKPGGALRVVVPNLENITSEYCRLLQENLQNPNKVSEANYDWILLEMYDQTVRNNTGGMMGEYLTCSDIPNVEYISDRLGYFEAGIPGFASPINLIGRFKDISLQKIYRFLWRKVKNIHVTNTQKVGAFRMSGEIHQWMYDRFSLGRLLANAGFREVCVVDPYLSSIRDWDMFSLDVMGGRPRNPTSLYMEARKYVQDCPPTNA
jgi:predicted SAM-dependent methyltransferase